MPLAVSPAAMVPNQKPAAVAQRDVGPYPNPRPRDPNKDVREFPAISPAEVYAKRKAAEKALYLDEKAKLLAGANAPPQAWFEDPVALGTLLIMFPPIGLAALWSSKRYSNDARWALTVMTALTMCLAAAITVAVMALRSS